MTTSNMLPPFAALRAFEAVFRSGGIRKAAVSLNINHAVVSRHIRLLEEWLGAPLFIKHGNRLTLTEPGAKYHARVSAALIDLAMATSEFRGDLIDKPLIVACVPGFCFQWLAGQIAQFEKDQPDTVIVLKPTDATPNLPAYEADVDIRYFRDIEAQQMNGRGLRYYELARPEVIPVASPELAERLTRLGTLEGLLTGPLLHEENRNEWRAWLALNGLDIQEPPGRLHWHAHLAIAAARQGRGVVLGNRFILEADLKSGALVEVTIPNAQPHPIGNYVFVAREDGWSKAPLSTLRHFLKARAL